MKANLAKITPSVSRVVVGNHPPITVTMLALADNGTLAEGLLVAKDAAGKIVAYNPGGAAPVNAVKGVLTQEIDTTADDAATVLRHGTVRAESLKVGAGAAAADDIEALVAIGIYAV
jgi:transcriptional regulator of nitric oxide reductase